MGCEVIYASETSYFQKLLGIWDFLFPSSKIFGLTHEIKLSDPFRDKKWSKIGQWMGGRNSWGKSV